MVPLEHIIGFSGALFGIGLFGLFLQPSMLRILLAVEAMLNGSAFLAIGSAVHLQDMDGQVLFLMVLAVAASEVGVGLVILLNYERMFQTLDISSVTGNFEE